MISAGEIGVWLRSITDDAVNYDEPENANVEEAAMRFVNAQIQNFQPTEDGETAKQHESRMQTMRTLVEFMMEYPE